MNVKDFIKLIQKKPQAVIHEIRTDYLDYVIAGFLCCNAMNDRRDDVDQHFHYYFTDWLVKWINKNIDNKYKKQHVLWHQTLMDVINDEQEAVYLFFQLCDEFFEEYEKSIKNE